MRCSYSRKISKRIENIIAFAQIFNRFVSNVTRKICFVFEAK